MKLRQAYEIEVGDFIVMQWPSNSAVAPHEVREVVLDGRGGVRISCRSGAVAMHASHDRIYTEEPA